MDLHLYPNALSRDRARREAVRAQGILFDHRHFTYPELFERLYRAQGLLRRPMEAAAQNMFVHHSVAAVMGTSPSPGLVSAYRDVLNELKGTGLEVADFTRCVALMAPELSSSARAALQRLQQIFERYQRCLAQAELVDRGDRDLAVLALLGEHTATGTMPTLLQGIRRVILHDVYQLSLVHYALVSLLLKLAEDGGVLQHFSDGMNVEAVTYAEFTWQRFVADESLASHVLPEFAMRLRQGGTLEALSERLFTSGPPAELLVPDDTLAVVAAPGRAREVESIARDVRQLLAYGVSPDQIAIVVRNLDQYGELFESVFRRYRIPAWFRRGTPLFHLPLVKTMFSLLELADSAYPRQALLKLLSSTYFRPGKDWPDDIVGLVNAAGYLDRTHVPLQRLLDEYVGRLQPGDADVNRVKALREWVEVLQLALDDFIAAPRSFLAYLEAFKRLLVQLGLFRVLGMQPDVPLYVIQRDREALRQTFETLHEGAEALHLLGDPPLAFAEFRLLAIDLLREMTLAQPVRDDGAVRVLGVRDVLGLDFDVVFVPGLADTEFPQHYSEHPVLDDAARRALNRAAQVVLAERYAGVLDRRLLTKPFLTTGETAREEPLFFFLALQAANQRCVLSYPTRTPEGETVFPSMFIDEVLRHFRPDDAGKPLVKPIPTLPSVPPPAQCLEPGELLRRAALAWRTTDAPADLAASAALDAALASQGVRVERLRQLAAVEGARKRYLLDTASATHIDAAPFGDIGRTIDLQSRFLDPDRPWSPTMLEDAAACPFSFFAKHVLRLSPRAEPDYDTSPLVLGELAHDILAEFWKVDPPRDARAAVQHMRRLAEARLATHTPRARLGHPGFWEVRKAELLAVLEDVAASIAEAQGDVYRTSYLEREMTGVTARGPWSIWLKGRVDRVAIRQGPLGISGVLVQDFKYSSAAERYRALVKPEALGKSSFQLPIYLVLALQQLQQDGHRVQEDAELLLEYLLLKDPERKVGGLQIERAMLAAESPDGLFDGVQRLMEQAIAGRFVPQPAEGKQTCTYCSYAALCRYWTSGVGAEAWSRRGLDAME